MPIWVIFDLDDTLIRNLQSSTAPDGIRLIPYMDTERILKFLFEREIPIALASFRTNADAVLRTHGLHKYFRAITHTRNVNTDKRVKYDMIQELSVKLGLSPSDAVFFDDMLENVKDCNQGLIYTVHIDPHIGVTFEILFDALYNMTKHPLYILSEQELNQKGICNYLVGYRVIFLDNNVNDEIAWLIANTDNNLVVLLISEPTTIEYFYHDNRVNAVHSDQYRNFDIGFALLRELNDKLPQPRGVIEEKEVNVVDDLDLT